MDVNMNAYIPDANITMIPGMAEEEWYRAGMAAHVATVPLRESALNIEESEMFVRVRRRAEPVFIVRVRRQAHPAGALSTRSPILAAALHKDRISA
jgi:hypothetical protein